MTQSPRLLDQVRQTIRLKHFSLQTEKSYVYDITQFILFHNKRHPRDMGVDEIRAYLSFSPTNYFRQFNLRFPTIVKGGFYQKLAAYVYFGRPDLEILPWEKIDRAIVLQPTKTS
jgi:S-adenosylmethionine synthetase